MRDLIKNRKATFNYEILEQYLGGLVLYGWEVKSIFAGTCSIAESYITITNKEVFLVNCTISKYKNIDKFIEIKENRERKLLLNKSEIKKLRKLKDEKGLTIIPLKIIYSDSRKIKIKFAICKGKKNYDKRASLKENQLKRDIQRELK